MVLRKGSLKRKFATLKIAARPARRLVVLVELVVPEGLTPGLFGDALQKALEDADFNVLKLHVSEVVK